MKKFSKRLTMIVAILLSLVLLTSSVVSTTLAKYVIRKESSTTVTLNKFGVEVDFTGIGSNPTKKGDSISYTTTLSMKPGDNKTITVKVKGKPTVESTITVDVAIGYTDADFTVESDDFTALAEDKIYFPIGFKIGSSSGTAAVVPYSNKNAATVSADIEDKIKTTLTGFTWSTENGVSSATWSTASSAPNYTSAKNISLYLYWPKGYNTTSGEDNPIYDEIGTYLSKSGTKTFTVTYTISIEQK